MKLSTTSIAILLSIAFSLKVSCGSSSEIRSKTKNTYEEEKQSSSDFDSDAEGALKAKKAMVLAGAAVAGAATAVMLPRALPKVGQVFNTALDAISKKRKLPKGILETADEPFLLSWAQPLDNVSDDIIQFNGKMLDQPSHQEKRIALVSAVYDITGRTVVETDNLIIHANKNAFAMEVTPRELDRVGRLAPVVFAGKIPSQLPANFQGSKKEFIMSEFKGFLKSINRTIHDSELKKIEDWLADLG